MLPSRGHFFQGQGLYLCSSAWELAWPTCININKAVCWGPPVRGRLCRGRRSDTSALTSRLISLSVRSTKKWGLELSQELLLGPCHPGMITELPLLYSHYYFHLSLPLFPKGGNPWSLKQGDPAGLSFFDFWCHLRWEVLTAVIFFIFTFLSTISTLLYRESMQNNERKC